MRQYPEEHQGVAVGDPTQVGGWRKITTEAGQTFTERVTDVGPGIRLGKILDISAAASVKHLGITSESRFPTGALAKVEPGKPTREQLEELQRQGLLVRKERYGELGGPEAKGDVEKQKELQRKLTSIGPWQTQVGLTAAESDFPKDVTERLDRPQLDGRTNLPQPDTSDLDRAMGNENRQKVEGSGKVTIDVDRPGAGSGAVADRLFRKTELPRQTQMEEARDGPKSPLAGRTAEN
jgi:hypothetical protein